MFHNLRYCLYLQMLVGKHANMKLILFSGCLNKCLPGTTIYNTSWYYNKVRVYYIWAYALFLMDFTAIIWLKINPDKMGTLRLNILHIRFLLSTGYKINNSGIVCFLYIYIIMVSVIHHFRILILSSVNSEYNKIQFNWITCNIH